MSYPFAPARVSAKPSRWWREFGELRRSFLARIFRRPVVRSVESPPFRPRLLPLHFGRGRDPAAAASSRSQFLFEPLEPRLLLSADPLTYVAQSDSAMDLTLRLMDDAGTPLLQLLDNAALDEAVLASRALADTSEIIVIGSDLDDSLTIDFGFDFGFDSLLVTFDGGTGADTLTGDEFLNSWNVSGIDSGTLGERVSFISVENLVGAADNQDTFTFTESGRIGGVIEGGAGGFDSLVVSGGAYTTVTYSASGPDSGLIHLDDDILAFSGLEPVDLTGLAPQNSFVFELTSNPGSTPGSTILGDQIRLRDVTTSGQMEIVSDDHPTPGFESVKFNNPTHSLVIKAAAGDDIITIESLDPGFDAALSIDAAGGGGISLDTDGSDGKVDSWDVVNIGDPSIGTPTINVGSLFVQGATEINVNANITATASTTNGASGDITLNADSTTTKSFDLAGLAPNTADVLEFLTSRVQSVASINIGDASGSTITLTADGDVSATVNAGRILDWLSFIPNFNLDSVVGRVDVVNATINATNVDIGVTASTDKHAGLLVDVFGLADVATEIIATMTPNPLVTFQNVALTGNPNLTFADVSLSGSLSLEFRDNGAADTITRTDGGSWISDGFVAGQLLEVLGAGDVNNNGIFEIAATTSSVLTLVSADALANESQVTLSGSPGLVFQDNVANADTITRDDGVRWDDDGFEVGQQITVTNSVSNSVSNDGAYLVDSISSDGLSLTLDPGDSLVNQTKKWCQCHWTLRHHRLCSRHLDSQFRQLDRRRVRSRSIYYGHRLEQQQRRNL